MLEEFKRLSLEEIIFQISYQSVLINISSKNISYMKDNNKDNLSYYLTKLIELIIKLN